MAADAIRCHLGSLKKDGSPYPQEDEAPFAEQIVVSIDRV
jgi:hypothetical protein